MMLSPHRQERTPDHAGPCPESPLRVGILLLPPCSMLSIGFAVDPLEKANALAGKKLYDIVFYTPEAKPLLLPCGVHLSTSGAFGAGFDGDILIVVAEAGAPFYGHASVIDALASLAGRKGLMLGGVHTGAYWLARAGLLDGYRTTLHWDHVPRFAKEFPRVPLSHNLYEIDGERFSGIGGTAILQLMLALIERQYGDELANLLSDELCVDRAGVANERQRGHWSARLAELQPKLGEAIQLMEANIEEPLTTEEIAHYVNLSRRQLERLFKQFMNAVPSRYYLRLRLEHARRMLQSSGESLVQIGLSCGFSSASHFSTSYRAHFGITPREERTRVLNRS